MSQGHAGSVEKKKKKKVSWNMICLKYRTLKKCLKFHSIFHSNDVDSRWRKSLSSRHMRSPVEHDAFMLPPKSAVGTSNLSHRQHHNDLIRGREVQYISNGSFFTSQPVALNEKMLLVVAKRACDLPAPNRHSEKWAMM